MDSLGHNLLLVVGDFQYFVVDIFNMCAGFYVGVC